MQKKKLGRPFVPNVYLEGFGNGYEVQSGVGIRKNGRSGGGRPVKSESSRIGIGYDSEDVEKSRFIDQIISRLTK